MVYERLAGMPKFINYNGLSLFFLKSEILVFVASFKTSKIILVEGISVQNNLFLENSQP